MCCSWKAATLVEADARIKGTPSPTTAENPE